jgi:hypothetical protein
MIDKIKSNAEFPVSQLGLSQYRICRARRPGIVRRRF